MTERTRTRSRSWQVPLRLSAGAYVLDSGLAKLRPDEAAAEHLHGFAAGAYPFLAAVPPKAFARALAVGEVLIGAASLVPVVPARAAGVGLLGFGAGLLGLYARTPGMRRPGSPFPSQDGIALAKDAWLAAIGAALVLGDDRGRA
jgi:uncharacterized membrane protein YphA (DoxX/SURF4 family)